MNDTDQNEPAFRVGDIVSFTGTVCARGYSPSVGVSSTDGRLMWFDSDELTLVKRPKPKRTVELDEEAILALWDKVILTDIHPTLLNPIYNAVEAIRAAER